LSRVKVEGTRKVSSRPDGVAGGKGENGLAEVEREGQGETLESRMKATWREGFQAGHEEGCKLGYAEVGSLVGSLETLRMGIEDSRSVLLKELEREIASLAMEIAEKLMLQELKVNPETIITVVRRVIERASDRKSLRIRISPDDCSILQERREELLAGIVELKHFDLVSDSSLRPGDCIVETKAGTIDARLDRRVERVREQLVGGVDTNAG
jgi:flagellar assembly protein FliH